MAVKRSELPTQLAQIQEPVDPAEEMILGNVVLKAEGVEQLLLLPVLASPPIILRTPSNDSRKSRRATQLFQPDLFLIGVGRGFGGCSPRADASP